MSLFNYFLEEIYEMDNLIFKIIIKNKTMRKNTYENYLTVN